MSFVATTSLHTITVLEPNPAIGTAMGVAYNYQATTPPVQYLCRVVPITGMERWQLLERGMVNPHHLYFNVHPAAIDERKRLRWEGMGLGTIFRVMSLAHNSSGLGRQYVLLADAKTEDNVVQDVQ